MFDPSTDDCSVGGPHKWMCMTVQEGEIVGVDSTGAPVFIPDDTAGLSPDSQSLGKPVYGCAVCSEVWDESLTTT